MDVHSWFETQLPLFPEAQIVDLIHIKQVGSERVQRFVLPEQNPTSVLSTILSHAEADAESYPGTTKQIYVLALTVFETGEVRSQFRYVVRTSDAASHDLEQPTNEGVLKQMMRMTAGMYKDSRHNFKAIQQALLNENERSAARCKELEERHMHMMRMHEDLLSLKHERDLAEFRARSDVHIKQEMVKSVAGLLPTVSAPLLSKLGVPMPEADPAIANLAKNLTPEQLKAIQSVLTKEQALALVGIFQRHTSATKPPPQTATTTANGTH